MLIFNIVHIASPVPRGESLGMRLHKHSLIVAWVHFTVCNMLCEWAKGNNIDMGTVHVHASDVKSSLDTRQRK